MSDLVVITYPDINQAGVVLNTLKRLVTEHVLDMDDAVYVTKDANGEVELHQMINLPGAGAASGGASGALWGGLIGLLFLQPVAGAAIGAAIGAGTGALAGKVADYGIDDNFVKQLSAQMTPNSSAIFVLVRRATVDKVLPEISAFGGTVLRTSLSNEAEQRLQTALSQPATGQPMPMSQAGGTEETTTPTA
ncbi:MAG: DUF1269 domain-containing protein [Ktedonobacterales bacterium]